MALDPSAVSISGGVTTILLGTAPSDNWNGTKLAAGNTYLFPGEGAIGVLERDIRDWEFDVAATSGNPIRIQVQGGEVRFVVPADVPARVTAGEIVFEAIDPFWTPADLPGILDYFLFNNADNHTADPFNWDGEIGTENLEELSSKTPPAFNSSTGHLEMRSGSPARTGFTVAQSDANRANLWYFGFSEIFGSNREQYLLSGSSNAANSWRLNSDGSSNGVGLRAVSGAPHGSQKAWWNGESDGDGNVVGGSFSGNDVAYPGVVNGQIPLQVPFMVGLIARTDLDYGSIGARIGQQRDLFANLLFMLRGTIDPTDTDMQRIQGWGAWNMFERGVIASPGVILPSDHPYYSERPLKAGGATSSVTFVVPSAVLTIARIPVGAEVRIYDLDSDLPDLGAELSGIEESPEATFQYTHSKGGDSVWLQVLTDEFEEFGQSITLSDESQLFELELEVEEND